MRTIFELFLLWCAGHLVPGYGMVCPISLPQCVSATDPCYSIRKSNLEKQRSTYGLIPPSAAFPYARLDMTPMQLIAHLKTNPFLGFHAKIQIALAIRTNVTYKSYIKTTSNLPLVGTIEEYGQILSILQPVPEKYFGQYVRRPSDYELYQTDYTTWLSDELFAEQRLAGTNPMSIQQVTFSKKRGLQWKDLKKLLNPSFHWRGALRRVLGGVMGTQSINWAIMKGYVFVLRLPLCDDMATMEDLYKTNDTSFERKMWPLLSPIALFVSVPTGILTNGESSRRLMPVAIQMDYKPESRVFTPQDGLKWVLAKLNVQLTDFGYNQMVEHLSKIHFPVELFCVSLERHLSNRHPLYAMMRFHCRGVLAANIFGAPKLVTPGGFVHHLYAYGWKGAFSFIRKASKVTLWDDMDLRKDTEKRGVNCPCTLPYYPYRDDGLAILNVIESLVKDYIDVYYRDDYAVKTDSEVHAFVSEISADGTGPYGGTGKIKGFPSQVCTKKLLVTIISRMIWLMSPQHAAVNYPVNDYGSYVPNSPSKLYNDTRGFTDGSFSVYNLENRNIAALQVRLFQVLGLLRLDRLFDYGPLLEDSEARAVLYRHYASLTRQVEPLLEERNTRRHQEGHLTYPYMLPRWLPNGVQS